LPVKENACGLRQSDAVFHHTQQLYALYSELVDNIDCSKIKAVGVSSKPRPVEGSYMPCFTVGINVARIIGATLGVPVYEFSHQEGHISSAILSSKHTELFNKDFIGFHVSGGTTEAVLAKPNGSGFSLDIVAQTLDLNAGQAIDRVGVMLGLQFPCGIALEKLALAYNGKINVKPTLKDCNCCLSGLENLCKNMYNKGDSKEKIAFFCLKYIDATLTKMTEKLLEKYGDLTLLYSGGVMSDSIIRNTLETKFNGIFATPELSSDNAVGIAYLTFRKAQND
jgi:N6-L-threonylcarbamoyladenine synthase